MHGHHDEYDSIIFYHRPHVLLPRTTFDGNPEKNTIAFKYQIFPFFSRHVDTQQFIYQERRQRRDWLLWRLLSYNVLRADHDDDAVIILINPGVSHLLLTHNSCGEIIFLAMSVHTRADHLSDIQHHQT